MKTDYTGNYYTESIIIWDWHQRRYLSVIATDMGRPLSATPNTGNEQLRIVGNKTSDLVTHRTLALLQEHGPMTLAEIAAELPDVTNQTLRNILHRNNGKLWRKAGIKKGKGKPVWIYEAISQGG